MRVSISAVMSCCDISIHSPTRGRFRRTLRRPADANSFNALPTGLPHSRNHAFQCKLTQHDAADSKLAVHTSRTTGDLAATDFSRRELRLFLHLRKDCLTGHTNDPFRLENAGFMPHHAERTACPTP